VPQLTGHLNILYHDEFVIRDSERSDKSLTVCDLGVDGARILIFGRVARVNENTQTPIGGLLNGESDPGDRRLWSADALSGWSGLRIDRLSKNTAFHS
jgi:hypothetical protein